jgi:hypothetical protein
MPELGGTVQSQGNAAHGATQITCGNRLSVFLTTKSSHSIGKGGEKSISIEHRSTVMGFETQG